jgi:hypothetical protein
MPKNIWIAICLLSSLLLVRAGSAQVISTISGKVIAEDTGEGLSEIRVRAMPGDFRALTNEKGIYTLKGLQRGKPYRLSFFRENTPYVNVFSSVEAVMPRDRSVLYVNHTMKLGAAVSGAAYSADGVTPLNGAAVAATALNQSGQVRSYKTTKTDDDGKFFIQGIPETDECIVGVAVYGHAWIEKTVKVMKGQTTGGLTFVLNWEDKTGISGQVWSKTGKPLLNARVLLIDDLGKTVGIALTSDTGTYSIVGVEPGVYQASVTLMGNHIATDDIEVRAGKSTDVEFQIDLKEHVPKK